MKEGPTPGNVDAPPSAGGEGDQYKGPCIWIQSWFGLYKIQQSLFLFRFVFLYFFILNVSGDKKNNTEKAKVNRLNGSVIFIEMLKKELACVKV